MTAPYKCQEDSRILQWATAASPRHTPNITLGSCRRSQLHTTKTPDTGLKGSRHVCDSISTQRKRTRGQSQTHPGNERPSQIWACTPRDMAASSQAAVRQTVVLAESCAGCDAERAHSALSVLTVEADSERDSPVACNPPTYQALKCRTCEPTKTPHPSQGGQNPPSHSPARMPARPPAPRPPRCCCHPTRQQQSVLTPPPLQAEAS